MNIAVIGTGYVGLVTGACFAEFGINVTCVDKDADKIERLERGRRSRSSSPASRRSCGATRQAGRLHFTTDAERAVQDSLVIFIAVPTPPQQDGSTDLSYVDEVARTIGDASRRLQGRRHQEHGAGEDRRARAPHDRRGRGARRARRASAARSRRTRSSCARAAPSRTSCARTAW